MDIIDMIVTNSHATLWFVGILLVYGIVNLCLRLFCNLPNTVRGSNGPNMMAFDLVSCSCCFYVGIAGCMAWFDYCPGCDLSDIESDRIYGRSVFFETHLGVPLMTYQLWNFIFSLIVKELRDPISLLHHVASGLCAFFSMHPFLQYYGLFFYGVPEVSSVPLTVVSLSKSFPFIKEDYPRLHNVGKWSFGVLFLIIRIVMWTYTSAFYWIDTVHLLTANEPPHSMFVVGFYCFANVVLTSMQYFWGYKIVRQMLNGGHKVKKNGKSKST